MSVTRWFTCLIFAMLLVTGNAAKAPAQSEALWAAHRAALSHFQEARYAEAVDAWSRARALALQELGPNHTITGQLTGNIGLAYYSQGNYAEAEPLYRRSLEINEAALGPTHHEVATSLDNLANLLQATGNYAEAEPLYRRALEIREAKTWIRCHRADRRARGQVTDFYRQNRRSAGPALTCYVNREIGRVN